MKKQEKIDLLALGVQDKQSCHCVFTYDTVYCYPRGISEKLILGQEEFDFQLDGFFIRKVSHLKNVKIENGKCAEISRVFGIVDQLENPNIDISSWHTVFNDLSKLDAYIIVEDEINGRFAIGVIEKVTKSKLYLRSFDAEAVWDEEPLEIPFSEITCVKWDCRYTRYWKRYMELDSAER